jgi:hypothetical protein
MRVQGQKSAKEYDTRMEYVLVICEVSRLAIAL